MNDQNVAGGITKIVSNVHTSRKATANDAANEAIKMLSKKKLIQATYARRDLIKKKYQKNISKKQIVNRRYGDDEKNDDTTNRKQNNEKPEVSGFHLVRVNLRKSQAVKTNEILKQQKILFTNDENYIPEEGDDDE